MSNINDFHYNLANEGSIDQRASATVSIDDYTLLSGKTFTIDGNVLTEGVDWIAGTDNDTTASSLASAIDGVVGFTASASGSTITIYYETPGTTGNSKAISTDTTSGMTLSGSTLSGGVAATYTNSFDVHEAREVEQILEVNTGGLSGTSPTIDITPQYSADNVNWHDDTFLFTQITSAPASETISRSTNGAYRRYKIVLGGTNPIWSAGIIHAIPKK